METANQNNWNDDSETEYVDSSDVTVTPEVVSNQSDVESAYDYDPSENDYDAYDELEFDDEYDEYGYYDDYEDDYDDAPEHPMLSTLIYTVIVLAFSVVFAVIMWFAADDILALTKADNTVTVTINEGDTLYDIAENLQDHGLVRYKYLFIMYGKFSHAESKIGPGTFELNQMFDYHALVNGLVSTSETRKTVTLTFPEGYSVSQIFQMLAENDVCSETALYDAAANYDFDYAFLSEVSYGNAKRLDGFMFPDTYEFYVDDDPIRVINKFLNNFETKLTDSMQDGIETLNQNIRSRMEEEGSYTEEEINNAQMDLYKIITVASLIEKEAGADSERALISSVIYNRLTTRVHELLQIDATVEYALGEHKEILTANDLGVDSPYNTYKYKGLPPGPIANPGISSIMAAIHPDTSDYYFYALNSYGTHEFFYTYMEQQDFLNSSTVDNTTSDTENSVPVGNGTATKDTEEDEEESYYQQPLNEQYDEEEPADDQ